MKCYKCLIELTEINWYPSHRQEHRNICKKCYYRAKKHYKLHNRLKMNGKFIKVKKRELLGFCELCKKNIKETDHFWHHWNDKYPEIGLWLCTKCHRLAESIEYDKNSELRQLYLRAKEELSYGI